MVTPRYGEYDADTPEARKAIHEQNRRSWNEATKAHNSHKADQAKFFREGGNKLDVEEFSVLGDLRGKSVLHLQCNSGQDTLSIKQSGAAFVAGVDISDEAIEFARGLSSDSGVEATFYRADIYDWLAEEAAGDRRWDVVFCSYGAIIWLSDLGTWAKNIASILLPGGHFATVEFHPVEMMFDEEYQHKYHYSTHGKPITWDEGVSDYIAFAGPSSAPSGWQEGVQGFQNPEIVHEFGWGLSEIITALLDAGLVLEHFREYDYAAHKLYNRMVDLGRGKWALPPDVPSFPLMYSIAARKPL
ncbi:MAG TPA: class I SAM-dependent methyltransferase [Dehalococcoidia bacterium]|nr:class I SAM-dependent methyltransferase [Dehalococcoidia bacterium]